MLKIENETYLTLKELRDMLQMQSSDGVRKWRLRYGVKCYRMGRYGHVKLSDVEKALLSSPTTKEQYDKGRKGGNK